MKAPSKKPLTLSDVKKRVKGLNRDTAKATVCALVGHSCIVTYFMWAFNCARCGAQMSDGLLGGAAKEGVIVGHNCGICKENYKNLTWRDKYLTPNPFKKESDT